MTRFGLLIAILVGVTLAWFLVFVFHVGWLGP